MGHFLRLGRPPRLTFSWHALWTSVWLSVLFLVAYSVSNWLTSLRSDHTTWAYAWEAYIPFIPAMILPYMSIDLFFVLAPFIMIDRRDRIVFAWRIALTILAAALCYLLFPLVLAVERPVVDGWLGMIFNPFVAMDKPHNLLPSLHVALGTILATYYLGRSTGWWRVGLGAWFVLIIISTLFTWQHHAIDLAGGFVLGVLALHVAQRKHLWLPVERNPRVAVYYGVGAVLLVALGWFLRPMGIVLLWPACAMLLMSQANLWLGPGIFRKQRGRLPWLTWIALWPVLIGQQLSLWWYARQGDAWNVIDHNVWVGRVLTAREAARAKAQGVHAVLDLTGEFTENRVFRSMPYLNLPVLDLTCPTDAQIADAMAFIRAHQSRGAVYIHCKIGYSRSAAIAGAWLLEEGKANDVARLIDQLKRARPQIVIRPEIRRLFESLVERLAARRASLATGGASAASAEAVYQQVWR